VDFPYQTITGMCLGALLSAPCRIDAAAADTVWRWEDAGGRIHFSNIQPAEGTASGEKIRLERQAPKTAAGLRPGERDALRTMERRQAHRQQQSRSTRRRNDHATASHRSSCRSSRDRLHSTRNREQRKQQSGFLRKNCW
jgi:hypothetical protein